MMRLADETFALRLLSSVRASRTLCCMSLRIPMFLMAAFGMVQRGHGHRPRFRMEAKRTLYRLMSENLARLKFPLAHFSG